MTNEEMADRAVALRQDKDREAWWIPLLDGLVVGHWTTAKEDAEYNRQRIRDRLVPLLQQAREEGAREAREHGLPGAPMSQEDLDALERGPALNIVRLNMGEKIFDHIRWMNRILCDAGQDTFADGFRSGHDSASENSFLTRRQVELIEQLCKAYPDDPSSPSLLISYLQPNEQRENGEWYVSVARYHRPGGNAREVLFNYRNADLRVALRMAERWIEGNCKGQDAGEVQMGLITRRLSDIG